MKYDRLALIARAELAAKERRDRRELSHATAVRQREAELAAWLVSEAPIWRKEARYVLDCIRKGRAPQRARTTNLRNWGPSPRPEMGLPTGEERQAEALVALLKTITDETVTSAALERAGLRNIAWLLV